MYFMNYYTKQSDNVIVCDVCPRHCRLKSGQSGFCYVRINTGFCVEFASYGHITGLAVDPVEKKPLYHFYPSTNTLSLGTYGCNMGCKFCQNYSTTKTRYNPFALPYVSPEQAVQAAHLHNCKSIAFTYNDPVVFLEYAIDTARIAKSEGLQTIAVSAGYIEGRAREALFSCMDALNIDLKGFGAEFYSKNCLADFKKVLDTINYIYTQTRCWLEITTLLIEGENDSDDMLNSQCAWIKENLGPNVPLHFSAFHPAYKFSNRPATSPATLMRACEIAKTHGLNYVYTGNIRNEKTSTTYCKCCGSPLIVRDGFRVVRYNLDEFARCNNCKTLCNGIFI